MKFLIITHVTHHDANGQYLGYAPYIREMNMWLKYVDKVKIIAPLQPSLSSGIEIPYKHKNLSFEKVPLFSLVSILQILATIFKLPLIMYKIFFGMCWADHIHLRCPGNMGLLGCILQVFFPSKPKTVKYAGNWDPNAKQPRSYKLQKWILSNTFLSRNIKVLVYGEWPNQTKNILPFFTASFSKDETETVEKEFSKEFKFLFVGSLVEGKQPFYAMSLIEGLKKSGKNVSLKVYGEGVLKPELENYIYSNKLTDFIKICGAISLQELKEEYENSHFSILPSKSEGWPKAVAEAMFFGCVPISTKVSCVPWMLDNGNRGVLLTEDFEKDINFILSLLGKKDLLKQMSEKALIWSRQYTLNYFESEVKKIL